MGALAPHTPDNWNPKKAFQFSSLTKSEARWRQVQSESGIDPGYTRSGRLQPLMDERALALAERRTADATRNWGDEFRWSVLQAPPSDWAPPSPTGAYLFDTLSARIHPAQACAALSGAIRALGGDVAKDGETQGQVIHATGWQGLLELSRIFGKPVGNGVKGQAALLGLKALEGTPQIFVDGMHIVPHWDGTVAVGSTSERAFDAPDRTDAAVDALVARAREALPILSEADVIRTWAGVRPRAQSRAPLLGPWPGRPGHFIANGGFKIGFGVAWEVADVMADLVLDGHDRIPEAFRPEAIGLG